jgi:hypothetical protein
MSMTNADEISTNAVSPVFTSLSSPNSLGEGLQDSCLSRKTKYSLKELI